MPASELPNDFIGLALVVLLLGVKHGFDADHLAAIDGMARHNVARRPRLARLSGVLFSLGHGLVVATVALIVSTLAQQWQAPPWLATFGAWLSILVLTGLALLNLGSAIGTPADLPAPLLGWRSSLFSRLLRAGSPLLVAGVGALFALSFDTISQATLFAVAGTRYAGWQSALLLAALFVAGMLVSDGLNGWWIARLLRRADHGARVASRTMALAVSGVSLLTAGLGIANQLLPQAGLAGEFGGAGFSVAIVMLIALSYAAGQKLAAGERHRQQRQQVLTNSTTAPRP